VNVTLWLLAGCALLAGVLSLWAYVTADPGADVNTVPAPPAQHSAKARGETTQRLRPAPPPALTRYEDPPWKLEPRERSH
jgi:hypothetical protein